MIDVVVRPESALAPTSDTASRVRIGRGGSAANVAVALARATRASDVEFVGCAGEDDAAQWFVDSLHLAGVRARLQRRPGSTGVVVSLVSADGQRAMMTDRGVNPRLDLGLLRRDLSEGLGHLHVSGYQVLDPVTRSEVAPLLRRARELGTSTSLDVCSLGPLLAAGSRVFDSALEHTTVLFANDEEARALSGRDDPDETLSALSQRVDTVVVTSGADGARAQRGDTVVTVSAVTTDVVDTTGAGDAATGTFLGARLDGATLQEALQRAMVEASRVVSTLGAG
jgi:sugar/nucleoside kinase (ribokinase family)